MFSSIKLMREHGCGLVNSGLRELDMIAQSPTILIIAQHVTAVLHGFQCFHAILTANFTLIAHFDSISRKFEIYEKPDVYYHEKEKLS